jgi:hypothetical protein
MSVNSQQRIVSLLSVPVVFLVVPGLVIGSSAATADTDGDASDTNSDDDGLDDSTEKSLGTDRSDR